MVCISVDREEKEAGNGCEAGKLFSSRQREKTKGEVEDKDNRMDEVVYSSWARDGKEETEKTLRGCLSLVIAGETKQVRDGRQMKRMNDVAR